MSDLRLLPPSSSHTKTSDSTTADTSIDTHARLIAAAKAEAQRLRTQAIREFGCGLFKTTTAP